MKAKIASGEESTFLLGGRKEVPLSKIIENPDNERKTFRNMEGLISTIKKYGVLEPPTVVPIEGGAYMLVTGHRRTRAAREAGLEKIEVMVRDPDSEVERRRKSVISNVQREDVPPVELAEGLQALIDEDPTISNQTELAAAIGKDKAWVSSMLRILSLPVELQERVGTSQQPISYDSAIKIAREDNPTFQAELVDDVVQGATIRDIRAKINERHGRPVSRKGGGSPSAEESGDRKPKMKLPTQQATSVIIQAEDTQPLTHERQVASLQDALKVAKRRQKDAADKAAGEAATPGRTGS